MDGTGLMANVFDTLQQFRADQDQQVTDVKSTVQEGITGQPADPATLSNDTLSKAVSGQTSTVVATAAQIQKITSSSIAQGFSGTNALEEFEYVNTGGVDPTLWDSSFLVGSAATAYIAVDDGHNAGMKWAAGQSNTVVDQFLHYIGPGRTSVTDYQKNTIIVNSASEPPGFFDGRRAWYRVYGRVSADGLTWVRGSVSCYGDSKIEYRIAGGTITTLGVPPAATGLNPGPAAALSLECGYQGSPLVFRFLVNGRVYATAIDGSAATAIGALYREHGWGEGQDGLLPGTLTQYTSNDNQPAGVVGSGVRIFRSGGAYSQSGAAVKLANNAFDSISQITPDITVNLTTGGITINRTGWYLFYSRLVHANYSTNIIGLLLLFKGANIIARLGGGGGATVIANIPVDGVPVYVTAGDEFFWGLLTNNGSAVSFGPGDATGTEFYAGAILLNASV